MPDFSPFEQIGLVGASIFAAAYLLLALGVLDSRSGTYYALNILGISLAMLSHVVSLNVSSALIQATSVAISLVGLFQASRRDREATVILRPTQSCAPADRNARRRSVRGAPKSRSGGPSSPIRP